MTQLYNTKALTKKRKDLRNTLTPAEASLWKYLKKIKDSFITTPPPVGGAPPYKGGEF